LRSKSSAGCCAKTHAKLSVSGVQNIVSKRGLSNGSWEYFLRYDGRVDRFVYLATSDGYAATLAEVKADAFGSPTTNTWYFVCGGYDGTNAWISVNAGTRNTVPFSTDIFDGTNTLRVGSGYPGGSSPEYLDGMVDDLMLYKRVLNTSEIGWLYNAGAGRTYAELTPLSAGTLTYTYGDTAHAHAVTHINGVQKYWYDANGNQTKRTDGSGTYDLAYDAENRLTQVKKNSTVIATFTYDGNGSRVKSMMGSETTVFIGGHYEVTNPGTGQTVTKYYFTGGQRVAMRKYTIPQSMTVEYFLGDHLGSTSVTTDSAGAKISEIRYKLWGEIRSSWTSQPATTPAYKLASYTFTGQFSDSYINLLWYGSRHYDPELGRFIQPDSIVPLATQGVQAWDRYAYTNNNPVRYNDPTGHCPTCLVGAVIGGVVGGVGYGIYSAYTGNFNGWHLAAAIGGGALAGALIGSAVGAPAAAEVAATTVATVTGGGAAVLEATGGDPSDEISAVEQTAQEVLPAAETTIGQMFEGASEIADDSLVAIHSAASDASILAKGLDPAFSQTGEKLTYLARMGDIRSLTPGDAATQLGINPANWAGKLTLWEVTGQYEKIFKYIGPGLSNLSQWASLEQLEKLRQHIQLP
jgi:RHS repeat-associated protein